MTEIDLEIVVFFKELKEMIYNGSSCLELHNRISEQSERIQRLFPKRHINTLRYGGNLIFRNQKTNIKLDASMHDLPGNPINEYDRFLGFIDIIIQKYQQ